MVQKVATDSDIVVEKGQGSVRKLRDMQVTVLDAFPHYYNPKQALEPEDRWTVFYHR